MESQDAVVSRSRKPLNLAERVMQITFGAKRDPEKSVSVRRLHTISAASVTSVTVSSITSSNTVGRETEIFE